MRSFLTLGALLFAAVAQAISATGGERLLVLLDDVADKDGYSTFLGDLESECRHLAATRPRPAKQSLEANWQSCRPRIQDHIRDTQERIVEPLPPRRAILRPHPPLPHKGQGYVLSGQQHHHRHALTTAGLGPNLAPNNLIKFVNADGNILLTTSSSNTVPSSLSGLLAELDITLPLERTGLVVDHFNYDAVSAADKHDVLALAPQSRPGVKSYFAPETKTSELLAVPSAVGHVLGANPLVNPILRAPSTAYSYNPKEQGDVLDADDLFAAGEQISIVSGFQARNSARFTVVGAAEMLSNTWFDATVKKAGGEKVKTWNREFAKRVSGWAFQEIGVLRVNSVDHRRDEPGVSEDPNPELYMLTNNVVSHDELPTEQVSMLTCGRRTACPCPSTRGTSGRPSPCPKATRCSSSSACSTPTGA